MTLRDEISFRWNDFLSTNQIVEKQNGNFEVFNNSLVFLLIQSHVPIEIIQLIVNTGIDINQQGHEDNTLLHCCILAKNNLVFDYLIKLPNISLNLRNEYGNTPLMLAGWNKCLEMLETLIEIPLIDMNIRNNQDLSLTMGCVVYNCLNEFKLLTTKSKIDLSKEINSHGSTLFHLICKSTNNEHNDFYQYLLQLTSIHKHVKDNKGSTPFMYLCKTGNLEWIKLLIPYLSIEQLNEKNNLGITGLYIATKYNHIEIIQFLCQQSQKQVDLNICDLQGVTSLMLACSLGYEDIVSLLIENKVNVLVKDNTGKTALVYSIESRQKKIASLLIQASSDLMDVI